MEQKALKEIWEEICFHLSDNINPNINENVFEQIVLRTLLERLLKWSQYRGEIKVKPQLHVGRQNFIAPDIVLYDSNNKAVIVLEIKRPSEDLNRSECLAQLQSYMRQTRAAFGILLGREIHVYYDGNLNPQDSPLLLSKISFNSDSLQGIEFVDLFYRENFMNRKYEPFLMAHIARLEREKKICVVRNKLISEDTKSEIMKYLENKFIDIDRDILTDAMNGISINISHPRNNLINNNKFENYINKQPETISVCKNKSSGKYFIYIEDLPDNEFHLINPEGRLIRLPSDHFEQPKEENIDYLSSYKLITEQQLEKFMEYESQTTGNLDTLNDNYLDHIERRGPRAVTRIQNERHRKRLPFGCTVDGKHFNRGSEAKAYLVQIRKVPRRDLPTCSTNWHKWLMDNQSRYNFNYQRDRE